MPMQELINRFPDTYFTRTMNDLLAIYRDLDQEIAAWMQCGKLTCPTGCGTCCETFEPHTGPAEAEYTALYLSLRAPELTARIETYRDAAQCIFYNPTGPGHCTIYPARPLLCRLFAFSSVRDKQGQTVFRLCAHMPDIGPTREFTGPEIPGMFGAYPPAMQEYSLQVQTLNSGGGSQPLRHSLHAALAKIGWLLINSQ